MSAPRFAPVVEKPVRTVQAYRARKAAERRAAVIEALQRHVEKTRGETK
jgi:hypothetical protein